MSEWAKFGLQWGIAGVILMAVAAGVRYGLWPFLTKQITDAQTARREELVLFDQRLEKKDALIERVVEKHTSAMDKHTKAIESMTGEFSKLAHRINGER